MYRSYMTVYQSTLVASFWLRKTACPCWKNKNRQRRIWCSVEKQAQSYSFSFIHGAEGEPWESEREQEITIGFLEDTTYKW